MSRLKQVIHEIHRRSLWQVLLIYCGAALVAYQAVQALTEGLGLPQWFPAFAIVLFIIGLPIVLATAFVHEVAAPTVKPPEATPLTEAEAARIEAEAAADQLESRRRHRFLTWRNAAATFVIVLAAWGVVATGWMLFGRGADESATADDRPSVAVLPLENRSGLEEDVYFTDGIHDEILTQLYKISGLSVRGRTSVMQYRDSPKNLREIGEDLNARYLLEGGVLRAGGTVRINIQLIDAQSDEHLWAESYDRELSVENLLTVQSEVALRIAGALEAELTPEERARIEEIPTDNLEAYDFYLRGREYYRRPGWLPENDRSMQRMWEQAVELDPSFALAHAWLSIVHTALYVTKQDSTEERLRRARAAADRALELDPDLPEGHLALAHYHFWVLHAHDQALSELAVAERGLPGDADLLQTRGWIYREQGRWEEAIADLERAVTLEPRYTTLLTDLGSIHNWLRRYDEAERYYDRALAIEPEYEDAVYSRAYVLMHRDGNLEPLQAYVSAYPEAHFFSRWVAEVWSHNYPAALAVLSQAEDPILIGMPHVYTGLTHMYAGQTELARAAFDSARVFLEAAVSQVPDDPVRHWGLASAYAGLGMKEAAVREMQRAIDLVPSWWGEPPNYLRGLAEIHTMVGDYDAAIDQLDYLLSIPSTVSVSSLRIHPMWDPLRDHPRFQALLEKYE
jgi:TolB-like protein/Tfp pilus assembly protein PilF